MNALLAAILAATIAGIVVLALACTVYGAWHACRDLTAWADGLRRTHAWARRRALPAPAGPAAHDDAQAAPGPEPIHDTRPGTDTDALRACHDIWRATPNRRWEENQ